MVERGAVAGAWVFRAFLPPHPALSLGERENRSPLRGESNELRTFLRLAARGNNL